MSVEVEAEREHDVKEAASEPFDTDFVERIDNHRRNKQDEIAYVHRLRDGNTSDDSKAIEVEFELLHGDETFTETFAIDTDTKHTVTVDDLMQKVGLDPASDSVADLANREVPTEYTAGEWSVTLDTDRTTSSSIDSRGRSATAATAMVWLAGFPLIFSLFAGPIGVVAGVAGLLFGYSSIVPLLFMPVVTALLTLAYFGAGKLMEGQSVEPLPGVFQRLDRTLSDDEISPSVFLFHVFTGGLFAED